MSLLPLSGPTAHGPELQCAAVVTNADKCLVFQELRLLPGELNALLICVVVASMALTPLLADFGAWFEEREQKVRPSRHPMHAAPRRARPWAVAG